VKFSGQIGNREGRGLASLPKKLGAKVEHKIQSLKSIPEFFQIFCRLLPGKKIKNFLDSVYRRCT